MVLRAKTRIFLLLVLTLLIVLEAYSVEIAEDRLKILAESEEYIPYISNYPLDKANDNIRDVILSIHSSNHDAYMAYNNIKALVDKYNLTDSVLIIAPQFLMAEHVSDIKSANLIYWGVSPFRGSSVAKVTPNGADFRISAYTILENIISDLSEKRVFPNIKSITIIGHSAGGQLVNRFAASNTVEDTHVRPTGIKMRYIVMNPSSYVYMSPKRAIKGSMKKFTVPDAKTINSNPGYDNYGYGLTKLYAYHRHKGLTREKIRQQYKRRNIIYMLGVKDAVPDASMSIHPSAMLQGPNRLKRGLIYYDHLIDEFGPEIKNRHKLVIIRNVGHSGRSMILSPLGAKNIIGDFVIQIKTPDKAHNVKTIK